MDTFGHEYTVQDVYFMTSEEHLGKVYEDLENPQTDTLLLSNGPKKAKQAHFRDLLLRMRPLYDWKTHRGHYTYNLYPTLR